MTTGSTYKTPGYSSTAAAKATQSAAQKRLAAMNMGPADVSQQAAVNRLIASGKSPYSSSGTYTQSLGYNKSTQVPTRQIDMSAVRGEQAGNIQSLANQQIAAAQPRPPAYQLPGVASSGGGGGRSGGGGAAPAPMMSQAMIDWIAQLLKNGAPAPEQFQGIDLPDYQQQAYRDFDPTRFNDLRTGLAGATEQDRGTITQANQDLMNFLNTNYRNAFANTDVSGGPQLGDNQDMIRQLMAAQGVTANPQYAGVLNEGQRAQQMAGDWRQAMAGNEDIAQRARLGNAGTTMNQNMLALNALSRAEQLGIGQQETAARGQWQQGADQWNEAQRQAAYQAAQQEAMTNWQRQNQVTDTNAQNTAAYRNQVLQALLGMANSNVGNTGITLPDMASLGLG